MFHVKRYAAFFLLAALLVGCASVSRDLVTGKKKAFGYDWSQQVQIGQEADPQIVAQYGVYDDPDLTAYVTRVGEKVLAQSHLRRADTPQEVLNTPFTFRVLDSPIINAFALPGGFIYITRGLLTHCENEAQLAMVLGHELTHVSRQHSARQAFEAQRSQYLLLGGAILGQATLGGSAAENILGLGGQVAQLLQLKYSRGDEREADHWGTEYAALAGYEAGEGAEFFRTLKRVQEKSGGSIPNWQSSHPDPGEREQTIRELAAEWQNKTPMNTLNRDELLAHVEGVVFGENPRNGFVQNNTFLHPELQFQFDVPRGYQVVNEASRVIVVEPNGQGYVIMTLSSQSAAQDAQAFAQQEGVRVADSGTDRVNGLPAAYVLAEAQTQQGVLAALFYAIEYGGNTYNFTGITSQQGYSTYGRDFQNLMRSFRALSDSRVLNVQPTRINVVRVSRATPFERLVPSSLPSNISALDLAIANQVELSDTIPAGTRVKLVN